jgi:hypothetical protein
MCLWKEGSIRAGKELTVSLFASLATNGQAGGNFSIKTAGIYEKRSESNSPGRRIVMTTPICSAGCFQPVIHHLVGRFFMAPSLDEFRFS